MKTVEGDSDEEIGDVVVVLGQAVNRNCKRYSGGGRSSNGVQRQTNSGRGRGGVGGAQGHLLVTVTGPRVRRDALSRRLFAHTARSPPLFVTAPQFVDSSAPQHLFVPDRAWSVSGQNEWVSAHDTAGSVRTARTRIPLHSCAQSRSTARNCAEGFRKGQALTRLGEDLSFTADKP